MKQTAEDSRNNQKIKAIAVWIPILIGLYLSSRYNYLLFHSIAELFSILVGSTIFLIAWNSRQYIKNPYLQFIGIAYLFISALDLFHTLSYKGMPIFQDYDYYANQLWIAARYLEAISLCAGFLFLSAKKNINAVNIFFGYLILTAILLASIFTWKIFPICFIDGSGLTPFKKFSEYIISAILGLNLFLLSKNKSEFEPKIFRFLLWSIICTIISELSFTFYISNYGFSNLVGHFFKIFSFYLIYEAIIVTCLKSPYELLFLELKKSEESLAEAQNIAKVGNWELDIKTNRMHWSDEVYRILGFTPHELKASLETYLKSTHPDDHMMVSDSFKNAIQENKPYKIDYRILLPDGEERFVQEQSKLIADKTGKTTKAVGTIQDITISKQEEKRREELIKKLQEALNEIKTLRGIIPICSYCKNVRGDDGYWKMVESYIKEHSEAEFSHSICPGCLEKHHPETFEHLLSTGTIKKSSTQNLFFSERN